ncbi:hypothetical protein HDU98_011458 [Podochytrium sp. JEL0797]|nr:hypothetical protein HDU98_011458 [Podochytrium sp. JEL0797]
MSSSPQTTRAPQKDQRRRCWAARDAYFGCLNLNKLWLNGLAVEGHDAIVALDVSKPNIRIQSDKSLSSDEKKKLFVCQKALDEFGEECLSSWVFHFSMLRVKEMQNKHLVDHQMQKEAELRSKPDDFWEKVKSTSK